MSRASKKQIREMRERRDDVICYCGNGVTTSDFISDIRDNDALPFDEVCAISDLGKWCTACLLNAEAVYYETVAGLDAPKTKELTFTKGNPAATALYDNPLTPLTKTKLQTQALSPGLGLKRSLYDLVDRVLPELYSLRREIAPIFVSKTLTTALTISNQYPKIIGPECARIRIRLVCFDSAGRQFHQDSLTLEPGDRYDAPIGDILHAALETSGAELDDTEISTGSCWIDMKQISDGYRGSIRPCFTIITGKSTSCVHTQEANGRKHFFTTLRQWPDERQFSSHLNLSKSPARITFRSQIRGRPETDKAIERVIPGRGADIFEIPISALDGPPDIGLYDYSCESNQTVRRHWLVADQALDHVSADHM